MWLKLLCSPNCTLPGSGKQLKKKPLLSRFQATDGNLPQRITSAYSTPLSTCRICNSCTSLPCRERPYTSSVPSLLKDCVTSAVVPSSLNVLGSITRVDLPCNLSCRYSKD